ncbi:MAG: ORF6N domain-containing protein, partial [Bacteroidota bacterium]
IVRSIILSQIYLLQSPLIFSFLKNQPLALTMIAEKNWDLFINRTQVLRLQNETSKGRGGTRYLPYAFTEQGVAMLSTLQVLHQSIKENGKKCERK